jgi:dimethylamine/trimethylamine dehydrogenase
VSRGGVEIACVFTSKPSEVPCDAVLLVTARNPCDALYLDLQARHADWSAAGIASVKLIGDANAPGLIAAAVYAGHRYAQELDAPDIGDALPFKRDLAELAPL